MFHAAGDLFVLIDYGSNKPGSILQQKHTDWWEDFLVDGRQVKAPVDIESLPPGQYRLKDAR